MTMLNQMKKSLGLLLLCTVLESHADVLIDVTATMVDPACNIRSENSSSPLAIDFNIINSSELNKSAVVKDFSLYISDCNFSKSLAMVLNPKGEVRCHITEKISWQPVLMGLVLILLK